MKHAKLLAGIVVCQLAGVVGSLFTAPAIPAWYATLDKPSFMPPGWLIGMVWIVLYTLMGISLFLVWQSPWKTRMAMDIFTAQLVLNAFWSVAFFGLRSPPAGLIVIILLWLAIVLTILEFKKTSRNAALLLMPYILWVSFAAFLNLTIVLMN